MKGEEEEEDDHLLVGLRTTQRESCLMILLIPRVHFVSVDFVLDVGKQWRRQDDAFSPCLWKPAVFPVELVWKSSDLSTKRVWVTHFTSSHLHQGCPHFDRRQSSVKWIETVVFLPDGSDRRIDQGLQRA